MEKMSVRVYYSLQMAAETLIERTVEVSEEELAQLIPPSPAGSSGGWPHWREAEELVCSIVKEEVFPDEVTYVGDIDALRRLGITSLAFELDHKGRGTMSSRPIYPGMASG